MDPHTARRDEPYRSRVLSGTGRESDDRHGSSSGRVRGAPAQARPVVGVDPGPDPGRADDRGGPLNHAGQRGPDRVDDAGLRGAVPVSPAAAPPAAGTPRVRDLAGDPPDDRRLLPRPAPRRDRQPRPGPAVPALAA